MELPYSYQSHPKTCVSHSEVSACSGCRDKEWFLNSQAGLAQNPTESLPMDYTQESVNNKTRPECASLPLNQVMKSLESNTLSQ